MAMQPYRYRICWAGDRYSKKDHGFRATKYMPGGTREQRDAMIAETLRLGAEWQQHYLVYLEVLGHPDRGHLTYETDNDGNDGGARLDYGGLIAMPYIEPADDSDEVEL